MDDDLRLRSVYLPVGMDDKLRQMAFARNTSKSEIIREFLEAGLAHEEAEKPVRRRIYKRPLKARGARAKR
jgi:hypothetical protein